MTEQTKSNLVDIVVDGGVIAHGADHGQLSEGSESRAIDLATIEGDITTGFIGGARNFEFVEFGGVALN